MNMKKMTPHITAVGAIAIFIILGLACASSHSQMLGVSNLDDAQVVIRRLDTEGGFIRIFIDGNTVGQIGSGQTGMYKITSGGTHTIYARYIGYDTDSSLGANSPILEFDINNNIHYFTIKLGPKRVTEIKKLETVSRGDSQPSNNNIAKAVENGAKVVMTSLQQKNLKDSKIAIVNISSQNSEMAEFVAAELEFKLVSGNFIVVDRNELDRIRREQKFQLSGDVDDKQIVSIGRFAGAGIVITGNISGTGAMRRLRLRALDTQTAEVRAAASEQF